MSNKQRQLVFKFLSIVLSFHLSASVIRLQQRERRVQSRSNQARNIGVAQEPNDTDEVVKINTRIVFVDVVVKEKRTGQPVRGLTLEDFQIFDDGKPRMITYFSHEGDKLRRPLALILVFDFDGARPDNLFGFGWLKKNQAILKSFAAALGQLSSADEVAVTAAAFGAEETPCTPLTWGQHRIQPLEVVEDLTNDRKKIEAALLSVSSLAKQVEDVYALFTPDTPYYPPGMICAPDKALEIATRRPNSQVVLLFITDDFSVVDVELRERLAKKLLQAGVPVYGLITKRNFFIDYGVSLFGVVGVKMPGKRRANAVQYLAEETGGEAVRVRDPAKYAETFGRLIDSLAARYTLGFTLGEDEADDGRMHRLEVKVKARDARGKARKLIVYARRGYYVPKEPTGSKVSEEKP